MDPEATAIHASRKVENPLAQAFSTLVMGICRMPTSLRIIWPSTMVWPVMAPRQALPT